MKHWRVCAALLIGFCSTARAQAPAVMSHGRFDQLRLYRPSAVPSGTVLFFSGGQGWDVRANRIAQALAAEGALVVGVDTASFVRQLESDSGDCEYPAGDIENLSHFAQAYEQLPNYQPPLLAGDRDGAALAYATLAQSKPGVFAGGLGVDFCPQLALRQSLCSGEHLRSTSRDGLLRLSAAEKLRHPFTIIESRSGNPACAASEGRAFIRSQPEGRIAAPAAVSHRQPADLLGLGTLRSAYAAMAKPERPQATVPEAVADLPVVEVPAATGMTGMTGDIFAVLLSGDGGWAGLDEDVAAALSARGIPVVGLDALRYFWTERTPEGMAADVDRLIQSYLQQWDKKRVILVGYSQGADVLPFVLNRLPASTRERIALSALLALSANAAFEFHLSNWVGDSGDHDTRPEVAKLAHQNILCVYGQEDEDALCPQLNPKAFRLVELPGSHHFNGDYDRLAQTLLDALQPEH